MPKPRRDTHEYLPIGFPEVDEYLLSDSFDDVIREIVRKMDAADAYDDD